MFVFVIYFIYKACKSYILGTRKLPPAALWCSHINRNSPGNSQSNNESGSDEDEIVDNVDTSTLADVRERVREFVLSNNDEPEPEPCETRAFNFDDEDVCETF